MYSLVVWPRRSRSSLTRSWRDGDLSAQVLGLCHVQSSFCLITTRGGAAYWILFFDSLGVRITPVGKSAFCIFFVRLSLDATNYLEIAFFATFSA